MSMFSGLEIHFENSFKNSAAVFSSTALASVESVAVPSDTADKVPSSLSIARWTAITTNRDAMKAELKYKHNTLVMSLTCHPQPALDSVQF